MEDRTSPCRGPTDRAPRVGSVFFPLDDELGLLPGNLAPRQHEHVVHLASWMPFAWAARMLEQLLGVQVSEETVRRLTEQAGASVAAAQTAQAKAPLQEGGSSRQDSPCSSGDPCGWSVRSLAAWGVGRSAHGSDWRGGRTLYC